MNSIQIKCKQKLKFFHLRVDENTLYFERKFKSSHTHENEDLKEYDLFDVKIQYVFDFCLVVESF